ncbi:MAG TPA: hypothetical protein VIF84_02660 [Candidatus Limnocylindrales bacterium]
MSDRDKIIETIERAQRETPVCIQCHESTAVEAREDGMWLVCSSLTEPKSVIRQLLTVDPQAWHTNQPIAGLEQAA